MSRVTLSVVIMAAVTALLRFLPFLALSGKRKTPPVVEKLASGLPCAVMGMLVVYCLRGTGFSAAKDFVPALAACAVTAAVYLPRKNTLLGIVCGTAAFMILTQAVFVG